VRYQQLHRNATEESKRSFRTLQQLRLQAQHHKEPTRRPNTDNTKEPATYSHQSSSNNDDDDNNQQEPTIAPATNTTIGTHKPTKQQLRLLLLQRQQ
jgi:hypothetical protein